MKRIQFLVFGLLLLFSFPASGNAEETPFENLGPQVKYVNAIKGKAGVNQYGEPVYYALLQGEPAKLAVIDLRTKQVVDMKELKGAKAAWSIEVSDDRTVWIGTTPNEHVYQYKPDSKELLDLGKATTPSDTVIWDMDYDQKNQRLYGVTSYGGRVFSYDKAKGFQNLGQAAPGKQYARSVVFDSVSNALFVGTGSPAALVKWDLSTGKKTDILPPDYKNSASVYDLDLAGRHLFAKIEGKTVLLHINADSGSLENVLEANSRGVSQIYQNNYVYYSNDGEIQEYNLQNKSVKPVHSNLYGSSAVSLDIVPVNGEPTLAGLSGNSGRFYTYGLVSKRFSNVMLNLPPQSVEIYRVGSGLNGEIYSSGFISGKLGVYHPQRGTAEMLQGLGQVEDFAAAPQGMYFGVYPNAGIYYYDSLQPWSANNPSKVISLSSMGQDRPVGIEVDDDRIFVATVPKKGQTAGRFVVVDTLKNEMIHETEIPHQQSAASMTKDHDKDVIYIGTSIYDGSGNRSKEGAQLLAVTENDDGFEMRSIPVLENYSSMVSALTMTSDGKLWGIADNQLFVYEPETEKMMVFPITDTPIKGMSKNENLIVSDGNLYGTLQGILFKVNQATYKITAYRTGDVFHLAKDTDGNLYYNSGANLFRIRPEQLKREHELNLDQLIIPNISVSDSPFPIARLYSKRNVTLYKEVNGAMIPDRKMAANQFYRVYGTKDRYYHVGGGYYMYHENGKTIPYIGRVSTLSQLPILKPDGSLFRLMMPGEELRVYSYDENGYDVGNGYKVLKNEEVTYSVGVVTLKEEAGMYQYGDSQPLLTLPAGEMYEIHKADGNKLDIGNGYYLVFEKEKMTFKKN